MSEQRSVSDAPSNDNIDLPSVEPHLQTDNTSTTPLAAPSIEGWPPISHTVIPPPTRDVVMTDSASIVNDVGTPLHRKKNIYIFYR